MLPLARRKPLFLTVGWAAPTGCHLDTPCCIASLAANTLGATQTLSYAGQHMANDKRLMEYHVPAVRLI